MVSLEHSFSEAVPYHEERLAELIARVAQRDQAAFRELYTVTSARLFGIAMALTRNRETAGEALQDAMMQVWRNAGRYLPSRGSPNVWLAGIVRYRALDIMAAARYRTGSSLDDLPDLVDESALSRLEQSADGKALLHCLQALDGTHRQGIILSYVHGFSHSEIARLLDLPLGTVKSWMRRGLMTLKTCLGS